MRENSLLIILFTLIGINEGGRRDCSWNFAPNPADCSTYFQCNQGEALLRSCPTSLHWNSLINACDWATNVKNGQCQVINNNNGGVLIQETHPSDVNHIEIDNNVHPETVDTIVVEALQPEEDLNGRDICAKSQYMKNSKDCSSFYICDHGALILQNCGAGLHWNPNLNTCDWPQNAGCIIDNSDPGSSPSLPPQTIIPPQNPPQAIIPPQNPPQAIIPPQNPPQAIIPPQNPPQAIIPPQNPPQAIIPPAQNQPPQISPPVQINHPGNDMSTMSPSGGKKVVCYFTDWAWYRPGAGKYMPKDIDPTLCTHVIYAFGLLDFNDYSIRPADSWADFDNYFYSNVTSLKARGTKVTLAIGGWNESGGSKYSAMVNSAANRARFVTSAVEYLTKYNFDGLDLDWEYPKCWQGNCNAGPSSDKSGFAQLVKELRAAFKPEWILSAAVSASKLIIDNGYDVPTLSHYLDWIGVMDYDFHGSWDKVTGHIAPLYYTPGDAVEYFNVDFSIKYWISQGAAPSKLLMGIPLYGQTFTLANPTLNGLNAPSYGPGQGGVFTRAGGVLSYYEICSEGWRNVVQSPNGTMGPYAYNGNLWVSFDDIGMVRKKSEYVLKNELGGAMIWALDMDDFSGVCRQGKYPLLSTIKNTFYPKPEFRG